METEPRPANSADGHGGPLDRASHWVFLVGDRRLVALGLTASLGGPFAGLVATGVLAVGPESSVAGLFGSGLVAGVVTLVTIALSINQFILSRVFDSPDALRNRLEGSRQVRRGVEELAGVPSSSNDPGAFLSLLADTLSERAATAARLAAADGALPASVTAALEDVAAYGRSIDGAVNPETPVADVLGVLVGPEYARNIRVVRHLHNSHGDALSAELRAELEAVEELLGFVAMGRQFFKTLALQQDFASLSRLLVYTGLPALLVAVSLTLVYRGESATLGEPVLRVAVPVAFAVVLAPLALFAAYILRAATVAYRSGSVGAFVPPEAQ